MSFLVFAGAVQQGLVYALTALSLLVSYRVLGLADLTVDGSFTLGAAVSGALALAGHPWLGLAAGLAAGAAAGLVTAFLQTRCGVAPILAGILTMTALYSINLMVMGGRSNLQLLRVATVFRPAQALGADLGPTLLLAAVAGLCGGALALFLRSGPGLALRAAGDNPEMVRASSIDPARAVRAGLALANALAALSGALMAQYRQFVEVSGGTGTVVLGLASLVIGEAVVRGGGMARRIAGAVLGAVLYQLLLSLALSAAVTPQNMKLVSAVLVAAAIGLPTARRRLAQERKKRKAVRENAARDRA